MKQVIGHRWLATLAVALVAVAAQAGDADAGRELSGTCITCHGEDGNSVIGIYPKLAGQNEKYLLRMLHAIKDGKSPAPLMAGQLDDMSDRDLEDIAAWYASQRMSGGAAKADLVELGEAIYHGGRPERQVAACAACHSPTGSGNAPAGYPRVAGQQAEYLSKRLLKYRDGTGVYDERSQIMRDIAARLSPEEIEAVSSYMQGLRVREE